MAMFVDITSLVKHKKAQLNDVVRRFTFEMFARIIMRSPVDTGRFRGAWAIGFGTPLASPLDGALDSGPVTPTGGGRSSTKSRVLSELSARGDAICEAVIYLTNSLPYAWVLEYGRVTASGYRPGSQQAPQGMVRVTINEFVVVLNRAQSAPFILNELS